MKKIKLSKNKVALIDDGDFVKVSKYKWSYCQTDYAGYATTRINGKKISMHRYLLNPPKGKIIDHKNGNGIDNRRLNIRVCTPAQNIQWAKRHRDNSSGFRGVSWYKRLKKWRADICCNGKSRTLGYYDNIKEAVEVYNRKAKELCGEYAYQNKIVDLRIGS